MLFVVGCLHFSLCHACCLLCVVCGWVLVVVRCRLFVLFVVFVCCLSCVVRRLWLAVCCVLLGVFVFGGRCALFVVCRLFLVVC